jgi:hypothetical protein
VKFSITHDYNVSADQLWKYLFDPALEKSVAVATNLKEFVVTPKDDGATLRRSVRVTPDIELPGPLKKLVGGAIGYNEIDIVPKNGPMEYKWDVTPDALPGKIHIGGVFRVEPTGANRCRRTIAGEVTVKVFGLGGLAEKFIISQLEETYGVVAQEQDRWIRQQSNA